MAAFCGFNIKTEAISLHIDSNATSPAMEAGLVDQESRDLNQFD